MRQDQPSAADLTATVRAWLETLADDLAPSQRYNLRVAVHLLGIVERELGEAPRLAPAELEDLNRLLGSSGDADAAVAELCRQLRDGRLDGAWDEALQHVAHLVELKMRVVRPGALD